MKIKKNAHISIAYNPNISSGILSNAKAKLHALNKLGINNYDFYLINDCIEKVDDGVKLVKLNHKNLFSEYYNKLFNKYKLIKQVINLEEYDKIIIRYPFADKSIVELVNSHKVFFEFHSTTQSSIDSYFKLEHPSKILMTINGLIRRNLESLFSERIYKSACGFIAVTDEIKNVESRSSNNKNFITISNGINSELYKTSRFRKYDGSNINMIMISSMESYWHGIERLIKSIDRYYGDIKFNLYLVGKFPTSNFTFKNNENKIIFTGILNEEETFNLLEDMHLGIGTLGLYKKDMQEAAVLKVREYVSRGIPFIKAYYDPDIDIIPELKPYYLSFPNNDSLIDIDKIIEFLSNLNSSVSEISNNMHSIAAKKLDWTIKMKEYVNFVNADNA